MKGKLIIALICFATIALSIWDPLNLNPNGLDGESVWVGLYGVLGLIAVIVAYKRLNK